MRKYTGILFACIICLSFIGCSEDEKTEYVAVPTQSMNSEGSETLTPLIWDRYEAPIVSEEGDEITVPMVNFLADGSMIMAENDFMSMGESRIEDGRRVTTLEVLVETAPGSHEFETVTVLERTNNATFIAPEDDMHVLVGDTKGIYRISLVEGTVEDVAQCKPYRAKLAEGTLYISGRDAENNCVVSSLSLNGEPGQQTLLTIPGASADVVIHNDEIYTAAGSGDIQGLIKHVPFEDIQDNAPLDLETAGEDFFQSESAGSMDILGDCMLVGNSVWNADNVCSVVSLADGREILSIDPRTDSAIDTYTVCVSAGRTALVSSDLTNFKMTYQPDNVTVFVAPTGRLISAINSLRP